jgi:hypothetical protein
MNAPTGSSAAERDHPGTLAYPGREGSGARVRVRHRDRRGRMLRAGRTLTACWGLAIVAVFLPVLHFVLVPGLLLLGPALAWAKLHEADTLLAVEGPCPACAAPLHATPGQPWRERTLLRCDACGRRLELVLPPSPAGTHEFPVPETGESR